MLDPFIIEEIRRREQAERESDHKRPVLEIPVEMPYWPPTGTKPEEPREERGVVVIEF